MPAIRIWVCALVLGLFNLGAVAQADFDRAKQGQRYRVWLAQFENDVRHYRSEIAKGGALSFGRAELVQADDAHE